MGFFIGVVVGVIGAAVSALLYQLCRIAYRALKKQTDDLESKV